MKKILTLFFVFLFVMVVSDMKLFKVNAEDTIITLSETKNHILADVDEVIDTTQIRMDGDFGLIYLNQATLTSTSPEVAITPTTITVSAKGVYPVQLTYGTDQLMLYVITKLSTETEYVIYEENFNSYANGALPSGFTMLNNVGQTGGSAAINNQRLMLSPSTIVLFPSYLSSFSNYIIEADMRMTDAANASRWTSVVFRYSTENYYQMAIRQDAMLANGVEFAKRSEGAWNVPATAAYSEALNPASTYNLKIDVFETSVKESINGTELITYDSLFEYTKGRIGVQADNVTVYYDNIKITLPEDYVTEDRFEFTQIVDVYQPTTNIVAPATTLVWFNNLTQLDLAREVERPATMIFRVDELLNVLDASGNILTTAMDAMIAIDGEIIPAFYTNDITTAEAVAEMLKDNRILDVFLISDESDVILAARNIHNVIRGVKHYPMEGISELSEEDMMDIRRETNSAQAVASIIPSTLLTRDKVFYMQKRLMTVWGSSSDDQSSLLHTILTGVNGILSNNFEEIFDLYQLFPANTHVRKPIMIAHRGLYEGYGASAENTIESALIALERGADVLELDVHITNDLEVVIIHDTSTARTAPDFDPITVSSAFLHQLKEIYLADPASDRTDLKIPTFREYLTAFKGTGVVIFIEIKPTVPLLNEYVRDIIEELDMFDQTVVITFGQQNIRDLNTLYPEMANGWLNSSVLNANNLESSLLNMISSIVPINSTLNPNYGPLSEAFADAIVHRGLTVWPWTIDEYESIINLYNFGVGGLTTNYIGYIEDTFNEFNLAQSKFEYVLGQSAPFTIQASISTPKGLTYPVKPTYTIFDPESTGIGFDHNGTINQVTQPGLAYAYTVFSSSFPDGSVLNLASELIQIQVRDPYTYQISFDTDQGSTVDPVSVTESGTLNLPANPTKTGYQFDGWYQDEAYTEEVESGLVPMENMTLYAKWLPITYTIEFETDGAALIDDQVVNFGDMVVLPDDPEKEGFDFKGWYTDMNFDQAFDEGVAPQSNLVLYARFEESSALTPFGIIGIIVGSTALIAGGLFLSLRFIKLKKI